MNTEHATSTPTKADQILVWLDSKRMLSCAPCAIPRQELDKIIATPAPSLTGEEVSDTPETDATLGTPHSFARLLEKSRTLERRLSTARAQDKAALAEKDAEIERIFLTISERNEEGRRVRKSVTETITALRAEVARLKAEVEEARRTITEIHNALQDAATEHNYLRTRLAQAESMVETWSVRSKTHQQAHEFAEQRVRELESVQNGNKLAFENCLAELIKRTQQRDALERIAAETDKALVAFEVMENALHIASSCPSGTDLAAWVGQLAEDKATLDSAMRLGMISVPATNDDGKPCRIGYSHRDALRSAIDASNPKTE